MDLEKIKKLTNLIEYCSRLEFEISDKNQLKLKDSYISISSIKKAKELEGQLNDAIQGIVAQYESELRKALAECADEK